MQGDARFREGDFQIQARAQTGEKKAGAGRRLRVFISRVSVVAVRDRVSGVLHLPLHAFLSHDELDPRSFIVDVDVIPGNPIPV
jgi:hypothetical protein